MEPLSSQRPAERPLKELFAELAQESGQLVRQEVALAKTEMTQKAVEAGREAAWVGAGGLLAHTGLLCLVGALVLGLGTLIPLWVSALIVGVLITAGGGLLARQGLLGLKRLDVVPRQTIHTLKEDSQWARQQVH